MTDHHVKVYPSKIALPKTEQLPGRIAAVATDKAPILPEVAEMVVNRIIDNASVAIAAINREPVANARTQALAHPSGNSGTGVSPVRRDYEKRTDETSVPLSRGATVFGLPSDQRFD